MDVAAHHYRSRLISTVFGQWVSYVAETKALEANADSIALAHHRPAVLQGAIFRLKWMLFVANKHRYNSILARIGRSFLLQKRGLCCLKQRVRNTRSGVPKPPPSSHERGNSHMGIHRMFVRWRCKTAVALKIGNAVRGSVNAAAATEAGGRRTLLVQEALKSWQIYKTGAVQRNKRYETGKQWFLQSLKKRYLGKISTMFQ